MNQTVCICDRIRLLEMTGDPDPIAPREIGTVTLISHHEDGDKLWHQIDVDWDHGRTLMLVLPPDQVEIVVDGNNDSVRRLQ